jgi:hypothetical protein
MLFFAQDRNFRISIELAELFGGARAGNPSADDEVTHRPFV